MSSDIYQFKTSFEAAYNEIRESQKKKEKVLQSDEARKGSADENAIQSYKDTMRIKLKRLSAAGMFIYHPIQFILL